MIQSQFYSDLLKKSFATEKEAVAAEKAEMAKRAEAEKAAKKAQEEKKKAQAQRAADAQEVEDAMKEAYAAYQVASDKMEAFIKKYGYYHTTVTNDRVRVPSLFDLISKLFD